MRIAVLTSHPIQYQAPIYRALAAMPNVEVKVFFCWDFGVKETLDPHFGRTIKWDVPLLDGYEHEFVRNFARHPGTATFGGLLNPTAPMRIAAWKPDALIVHGYTHFTDLETILAAKALRIPVLLRGESNLLPPRPAWKRKLKEVALGPLLRQLDGVISIGTLNTEYYRHYGVEERRITLAPYSVDNAFFQARRPAAEERARAWRTELGISVEEKVVLFAAKLIGLKGCEDLIRAYTRRARPGTSLVIVGDGPLRPRLEALARESPSASIRFVGFVNQSEMPAAYALGNLFVLPSHHEPWGLAVNEAMNMGLPVIVSNQVGSAPDLVTRENGWVFQAANVDGLDALLTEALLSGTSLLAKRDVSLRRILEWGIKQTAQGYLDAASNAF